MSKVLVKVNSQEITEENLNEMMNAYKQQTQQPEITDEQRDMLLGTLVQGTLLQEEAVERNLEVTDELLNSQLEIMYQQYGGEENLKSLLAKQNIEFSKISDGIKNDLKGQLTAKDELDKKLVIEDSEIKEFYEANSDSIKVDESFRASHILFSTESDEDAAKESAEKVLEELKNSADFAEMAKEHSTCPSKEKGGDLNFFGKGQMVPEFEEAVISLKNGEFSDLIKTQFGYHIIKKTDSKEAKQLSFDEAKEQIKELINKKKSEVIIQDLIKVLEDKFTVEYM
jgi:parvulin-like peptidyl-prolyl isomerase